MLMCISLKFHHDISPLLKLRASAWRAMKHPSLAVESLIGRI